MEQVNKQLQRLAKVMQNKKIQDSQDPKVLKENLEKLGIEVEKESSFYLIGEGRAVAITADIFSLIPNDEIQAKDLYKHIEEASVTYTKGDILTAKSDSGENYTFIFFEELNDGTLLGVGQCAFGLTNEKMRYTKSKCRKANAAERAHLAKQFEEFNVKLKFVDGRVDIFMLRRYGQQYFMVTMNFTEGKLEVVECVEEYDDFDTECYLRGNYFRTPEEALSFAQSFTAKMNA